MKTELQVNLKYAEVHVLLVSLKLYYLIFGQLEVGKKES